MGMSLRPQIPYVVFAGSAVYTVHISMGAGTILVAGGPLTPPPTHIPNCADFGSLWVVLGRYGSLLGRFGLLWVVLGCCGLRWDALDCVGLRGRRFRLAQTKKFFAASLDFWFAQAKTLHSDAQLEGQI